MKRKTSTANATIVCKPAPRIPKESSVVQKWSVSAIGKQSRSPKKVSYASEAIPAHFPRAKHPFSKETRFPIPSAFFLNAMLVPETSVEKTASSP